jgi:cytochrome c oxidase subunit 1
MVSDVIAVFARKPIFGYRAMAYSMVGISGLGYIVWGHHMFQSGMNPRLGFAFMVATMLIALPSAIKVFNWLGTLYGGQIRFTAAMLNALAFVTMFLIGGLSGVYMASTPVDIFIHDTYFIVAHIHYVLFGGSIFAIFAAIYYWFPKMFGKMMNETLGVLHFAITFIAFNVTFFPMHIIGVGGHMRRIANPVYYDFIKPMQHWNVIITIGAFCLGLGQILFVINFFMSLARGRVAEQNPWNANTLEWASPTPGIHGNWPAEVPTVYRGPYEYSSPEVKEDWLPQNRSLGTAVAQGAHH